MDKKETVLITGATSGIGLELSKLFAADKYNLILVSRNEEKLSNLASHFNNTYGINAIYFKKDLSKQNSANELYKSISDLNITVDILVNNAGFGICGLFTQIKNEVYSSMIELNITSLTILTKLFAKKMIERGKGRILNVASTGSYVAGPYTAAYYATKAYVLSLTEAISIELKGTGVSISALCPGATLTGFAKRAGKKDLKNAMSPEKVAKTAYKKFLNGKKIIIPGFSNNFLLLFSKFMPRSLSANIIGLTQKNLLVKK